MSVLMVRGGRALGAGGADIAHQMRCVSARMIDVASLHGYGARYGPNKRPIPYRIAKPRITKRGAE